MAAHEHGSADKKRFGREPLRLEGGVIYMQRGSAQLDGISERD